MKKLLKIPVLLFVLMLNVFSCEKETKSDDKKTGFKQDKVSSFHHELVPEDSPFVGTIDVKSIGKKAAIGKLKNFKIFDELENLAKNNRESKKAFDKYIDKFKESLFSEIKFLDGFTYFVIPNGNEDIALAIAFDIDDHKKIEEGMKDLFDEFGLPSSFYDLDELDDNDYGSLFTEIGALAWDDESAIFIGSPNYNYGNDNSVDKMDSLLEDIFDDKKEGNSIKENESFNNFYKNKGDLGMWASTEAFIEMAETMAGQNFEELLYDISNNEFSDVYNASDIKELIKDSYYMANLNFNEGEVVLKVDVELNDDMKKTVKNLYNDGVDKDMLKIFPANTLLLGSASFNTSEILDYITDNLPREQKREFKKAEAELVNMFNDDFEFDKLASRIGSIAGGITGFGARDIVYYGVMLEFDKFSKLYNDIEYMFEDNMEIYEEIDDNVYYMLADRNSDPLYMSYNKDYVFLTNKRRDAKNFANKKYDSKNFSSTSYGKSFTDNSLNMYLNMDLDKIPDFIVDEMESEMGNMVISKLEDITKSLEFKTSGLESEIVLKVKGDKNVLFMIAEEIKNIELYDLSKMF